MEKIGFSEVGRGLLFIMRPCQADTAAGREQETISVKQQTPGGCEMMEKRTEKMGDADGRWSARGRFLDLSQ